ncbi:MAG TPA: ester cyclase, partial [Vicinamibacterales bacterium]|nr:ester cyclase [Vicinamibacterales bacterium]
AFAQGDIRAIVDACTDDSEWLLPGTSEVPWSGVWRGRQQIEKFFAVVAETVEFEQYEPQDFIAQDDTVVVLGQERFRVKATAKTVENPWVLVFRLGDGQIARLRSYEDSAAVAAAFRNEPEDATNRNKEAFVAICDIFNTGDLSNVNALLAHDYVDHDDLPPGVGQDVAGFKQLVKMYRTALPDLRGSVEQVVAEGDLVTGRVLTTGTNTGSLMGMPPTGKAVHFWEFHTVRFVNGKCVEHWGLVDMMTMMQQLGVVPTQSV